MYCHTCDTFYDYVCSIIVASPRIKPKFQFQSKSSLLNSRHKLLFVAIDVAILATHCFCYCFANFEHCCLCCYCRYGCYLLARGVNEPLKANTETKQNKQIFI